MQSAHAGSSLESLLREEVEARPVVAYRLLELLARTGWAIRIDRGERIQLEAERGSAALRTSGETLGEAAVAIFVEAAGQASREGGPSKRRKDRMQAA